MICVNLYMMMAIKTKEGLLGKLLLLLLEDLRGRG